MPTGIVLLSSRMLMRLAVYFVRHSGESATRFGVITRIALLPQASVVHLWQ